MTDADKSIDRSIAIRTGRRTNVRMTGAWSAAAKQVTMRGREHP